MRSRGQGELSGAGAEVDDHRVVVKTKGAEQIDLGYGVSVSLSS